MKNNKVKIIIAVVLVVAIVILAVVLYLVLKDVQDRNTLIKQINTVIEEKTSNTEQVLTGEYGKVEKQLKEDYRTYFEAIDAIQTNNDEVENMKVKNIENYKNDGPNFTTSLDSISKVKTSNEEYIRVLNDLVDETKMEERAAAAGIEGKYKELYFEIIEDAKLKDNVTSSVEAANQMNTYYDALTNLLTYMKDNQTEWFIENDTLKSRSQTFIDEYDRLVQEANM